ncbi:MarR family winged helix-turn-helix transcriptional regulator [Ruminiclostridium cellulolyticum]|uniref:Transcriptional regulator, MarR family n=1 Tax=Ruminiclostridium cellulolyticum (strain ATCC 35319 / DSM 5812 / JCM 6584 / H10) TaxID=394503 RepID=B8I3U8_RUMCH|nr:MarR family transcriptional regulator [Ruminiclostridium cellulolyticum]ACL74425.1 transcriptional regulator, MarR family [Ruminiclostridium cellulolyticum H10]
MEPKELNLLLIKVGAIHRRKSANEFMKQELSSGQPRILNYLFQNNGCIQREIAVDFNMEPASITSVLNSMEKAGLIVREPVKGDKRALEVRLTDKGYEKKKVVDDIFIKVEDACFQNFNEEEKLQAKNFLKRIHNNLLKWEPDN